MSVPKKFGFIRTTLALWAADVGAFVRGGVVSDSPNGGNAWGVNIPGTGWIYAAMRGASETFGNLSLTGHLTLNNAARPAWAVNAVVLDSVTSIWQIGGQSRFGRNVYYDGAAFRAIATLDGADYAQFLGLGSNGSIVGYASQTPAVTGAVLSDMVFRWQFDRFGSLSANGWVRSSGRVSAITAKTSAYTVTAYDEVIEISGTSIFNVLLPATAIPGQVYTIKRKDANTTAHTVTAGGTTTIDGATTFTFSSAWQVLRVIGSTASSYSVI